MLGELKPKGPQGSRLTSYSHHFVQPLCPQSTTGTFTHGGIRGSSFSGHTSRLKRPSGIEQKAHTEFPAGSLASGAVQWIAPIVWTTCSRRDLTINLTINSDHQFDHQLSACDPSSGTLRLSGRPAGGAGFDPGI